MLFVVMGAHCSNNSMMTVPSSGPMSIRPAGDVHRDDGVACRTTSFGTDSLTVGRSVHSAGSRPTLATPVRLLARQRWWSPRRAPRRSRGIPQVRWCMTGDGHPSMKTTAASWLDSTPKRGSDEGFAWTKNQPSCRLTLGYGLSDGQALRSPCFQPPIPSRPLPSSVPRWLFQAGWPNPTRKRKFWMHIAVVFGLLCALGGTRFFMVMGTVSATQAAPC